MLIPLMEDWLKELDRKMDGRTVKYYSSWTTLQSTLNIIVNHYKFLIQVGLPQNV
jgi:hypothetical protein